MEGQVAGSRTGGHGQVGLLRIWFECTAFRIKAVVHDFIRSQVGDQQESAGRILDHLVGMGALLPLTVRSASLSFYHG